jgi:D-xylose 1-dehydrogenase (NADP+, D-xylono-1,5-lactone-forming)
MRAAAGSEPVAIASRDPQRAQRMAARHLVPRVHPTYEALLADPEVDAVYVALSNDRHHPWTLRALAAGKHVLCEKPLALNREEGEEMAAAAQASGRLLMEAFMYRFLPRMRSLAGSLEGHVIRHLHTAFGFTIRDPDNYRMRAELGGGALYDVGCYCVDVARWLLGEPDGVSAYMRGAEVDMSTGALLHFESGATASLFASFESPEHQVLEVVTDGEVLRIEKPFGATEQVNPYQLMLEEFAAAAVSGGPAPLPIEWSVGNLRVLDGIRSAAAGATPT